MSLVACVYRSAGEEPDRVRLVVDPLLVGQDEDTDICLPFPDIAAHQARIVPTDAGWVIEDLGGQVTTLVNNIPLFSKKLLKPGMEIELGPCRIIITEENERQPQSTGAPDSTEEGVVSPNKQSDKPLSHASRSPEELARQKTINDIKYKIHRQMIDSLKLVNLLEVDKKTLQDARTILNELIMAISLPPDTSQEQLVQEIFDEAFGLGPLEPLLKDEAVSEIMVNHKDQIYVERHGKLTLTDCTFSSEDKLRLVIDRIVTPLGRRVDEGSPLVDARLKDGSRVNAIIPPLAIKGPCITIRKFSKDPLTVHDLIKFGSFTEQMGEFFELAVKQRRNIVISGGTGSGKTTLLNVISGFIPHDERIVTIEDAAELQLPQEHVVSLEARPPNVEGKGGVYIRDLVINALRMRPDRIVVGECRGKEALDMLQAMNTGHDGSLTTGHANTTRDILSRLETMVLMAGMDLPIRAIREQLSAAVHIIIQQSRLADGTRKVVDVVELTGLESDKITMQQIFYFKQEGFDAQGNIIGKFVATGQIPNFIQGVRERGIDIDLSMFRPEVEE